MKVVLAGRGLLLALALVAGAFGAPSAEKDGATVRWCVPEQLQANCSRLTSAAGVGIECVSGLDRTECLRLVRNRQADFVMADPEDLYVAMKMENQDFAVFAEQRTTEEPASPFRYEGIMLVRAADGFRSLEDLRGKKSCHTGFGRNVGYKIPVARLQRAGLLKLPVADGALSTVERELTALSEFFNAACLPGPYSPHADNDVLLKHRFANLCERCDAPAQCDKQDRYAGYEGAIRCLVENSGDVAFTKTIFVRKYFGLPVTPGGTAQPARNPAARPEDYVYLCEDGTTRPIADGTAPCSWAQRPWPVLLTNGDYSGTRSQRLQDATQQLDRFYNGPQSTAPEADRSAVVALGIKATNPLVNRKELMAPGDYLRKANYVEVIEREGPYGSAVRLCVTSEPERQKCEVLRRVAYSRDVRPALQCVLKTEEACVEAVRSGKEADVVVLNKYSSQLKAVVTEVYADGAAKTNGAKNGDASTGATVYVRPEMDEAEQDSIVHAFIALSETFGAGKPNALVFRLFGSFRVEGQADPISNLMFHDNAAKLAALNKNSLADN
ncbi:transferrin [Anopheles ziemanni]|uniref:transferrin n=1 Tax=Anopheles coustani TaxID=139045 RepID=UPI002659BF3D|nr:transferrin [Anopheles coustani]XP_058175662.1 transferrin [Anopheles ziemanni]